MQSSRAVLRLARCLASLSFKLPRTARGGPSPFVRNRWKGTLSALAQRKAILDRERPQTRSRRRRRLPSIHRALALARSVLATEAKAITALSARLGEPFIAAVEMILNCRGRIVVSGIGKSGHSGRKLAATLASTGTPAFFVHPADASHGDLGMITPDDVVLMLSNSGETDELVALTPHLKRGRAPHCPHRQERSSLAQSPTCIDAAVDEEACPLGLADGEHHQALALGDAGAGLLDARGFSAEDFARSHPGERWEAAHARRRRDAHGCATVASLLTATLAEASSR